jgi:hydrogenase expression/formation protein HypE
MTSRWTEELVESRIEQRRRARPRFTDDRITLAHGAGGKASRALVEGLVVPILGGPTLAQLGDAAVLGTVTESLAFTTDSFVVRPIDFAGGCIGSLAINGTVNDLAVSGARPWVVSVALVLEEGLEGEVLAAQLVAMSAAAEEARVAIVCGDTKVVERGHADRMYVTTSGVGLVDERAQLDPRNVRPGDQMLVSGMVGDHGMAVLLARGELELSADVRSDSCSLWPCVDALLRACGSGLRCMRDATRGGVATVANEIALAAEVGITIDEAAVPVRPAVAGACELLGIDPLYVANEGKLVAFVAPELAGAAVDALRTTAAGADAAVIGEVTANPPGRVLGRTAFGGHRMIDLLVGDPLPRIC